MPLTFDKFTIKAQEAVQEAVNIAQRNGQQTIEPVHLLSGILEKATDVTNYIFQKLGMNGQQIAMLLRQEMQHLPRVQGGGQPYLSNETNQILMNAEDTAKKMGDEFVSVEPILLAIVQGNSTAARILKDAGANAKDMLAAIQALRQGQNVKSQSADDNYQSLEKYAKNLVAECGDLSVLLSLKHISCFIVNSLRNEVPLSVCKFTFFYHYHQMFSHKTEELCPIFPRLFPQPL